MHTRALAWAAAALLCAACRSAGGHAAARPDVREVAAQAHTPALGPQIASDVGGRFAPGLEALQAAVAAGEDELARSLIAHVDSLGPDERVWNMTRAFERILDGRAAVHALALSLECIPEPLETLLPGAETGSQGWRLVFRAENRSADEIVLSPGPATLLSTRTDLGRRGAESSTQETRSFERLKKFAVPPNASADVELARFFLAPVEGPLAVRLSFEFELRSGVLQRAGRELPAMHLAVRPARATRRAADLPTDTLSTAELLAASAGLSSPEELLALAVRTEPEPGGADLDGLAAQLAERPRTTLALWVPALRWLAGSGVPSDPDGLRAWLRNRGARREEAGVRPNLVLPSEPRADADGAH